MEPAPTEATPGQLGQLQVRHLECEPPGPADAELAGTQMYFEPAAHEGVHPGTTIELSEVAGPKGKLFRIIREASEGWDGHDPVRPFPDLSKL